MTKHGNIPQSTSPQANVPLEGGLVKTLIDAAVRAVPTQLQPETAKWWATDTNRKRSDVLAEAVRDTVYRPPTLRNKLESWRRFYATVFDYELELPAIALDNSDNSVGNDLAEGYVIVDTSCLVPIKILQVRKKFPQIFCQSSGLIFHGTMEPIRPVGVFRNFPLYVTRIVPLKEGSYFELGTDEGDVTFNELLIQQLYMYWSGGTLTEGWLYANGSRVSGRDLVPAIMWDQRKIFVETSPRNTIKKNLRIDRTLALK